MKYYQDLNFEMDPINIINILIEGNLEIKFPIIYINEKQSRAEAERRERLGERKIEEKESEERDDRKDRKIAIYYNFPINWGSCGASWPDEK